MDRVMRALRITGILGSICGVIGYLGFFVGGDFGAFVEGACLASCSAFPSSCCS